MLSLRNISKRYGAVQAVREVSVDCQAGEIHALVGENGSGKSTLLGIASGFVVPDEGSVEIGGRPLATASVGEAIRLGLGMAYQTYSLVLEMSVAENLYLAALPTARPAYGDMEDWAAEKLEEFGLDSPATMPAGRLSLADRQLLEVVKALLAEPKVLLLDEPTTALGPEEIRRLHALVFEQSRNGVGGDVREPPDSGGARDRRPDHRPARRGEPGHLRRRPRCPRTALVALMIGRPLQMAFPERDSDRGPSEICLEVAGFEGDRFGPIDVTVHGAKYSASPAPRATARCQFLRARRRGRALDGHGRGATAEVLDDRSPARSAPGRHRAPERRPGSRVAVPGPQRPGEHDDPGTSALQPPRRAQPSARAT